MTIHEYGRKENPVLLLLPGTMCHWKGNFDGVIDQLAEDFLVACVAYTGFDEADQEEYQSVTDEVQRIEAEVLNRSVMNKCSTQSFFLSGTTPKTAGASLCLPSSTYKEV